jgi:hypothetical protein
MLAAEPVKTGLWRERWAVLGSRLVFPTQPPQHQSPDAVSPIRCLLRSISVYLGSAKDARLIGDAISK